MCIRAELQCNGDNDCGDYSDEKNCTDEQLARYKPFVTDCVSLPQLTYAALPGAGYNILTGQRCSSDHRFLAFYYAFFGTHGLFTAEPISVQSKIVLRKEI